MTTSLKESTGSLLDRSKESKSGKRWRVKLIEAGQGSSAFYPAQVLQDYASVFSSGTHMYLDHPLASEESSRPERSVRDLVGRLVTEAEYEDGALYAEAEFVPWALPVVEGMHDMIGLSIRAYGTANDTDEGPVLSSFMGVESVDLVTKPGAGGRFIEALESARPVKEAKANDRREQLVALVSQPDRFVYVRDFDDATNTVWYENEEGIYQRTYQVVDDVASSLNNDIVKVTSTTEYVPVNSPDTTNKENSMNEAQEAKLDALTEALSGLTTLLKPLAEGASPVPPEAGNEEGEALNPLEAAKALAASELSEAGQVQALARVERGVALDEAIKEQKEYEDSVRESSGGVHVVDESQKPVAVPFKKIGA